MAVVAKVKRKEDKKYSHLKDLYKKESLEIKSDVSIDEVDISKLIKEKKITTKQLLQDFTLMIGVIAVSFIGYILSRFI